MKKHRNFLVFYSLWLAAITGIFVVVGEENPKEYLKADSKICTLADDHLQRTTTTAYDKKKCDLKNL